MRYHHRIDETQRRLFRYGYTNDNNKHYNISWGINNKFVLLVVILQVLDVVFECNHNIKIIDAWGYTTIITYTLFKNNHNRKRMLGGRLSQCCMVSKDDPKVSSLDNDDSVLNVHHNVANSNTSIRNDDVYTNNNIVSLSLLRPSSSCNVDQMSGTDLAYIGDVVYELYIRSRTVWPSKRTSDLQQQVVAYVRAEHQSQLLHKLRHETDTNNNNNSNSFILSMKDIQVLNRGRNAVTNRKNTNHRHHPNIYQDSTAFEALLGYLYISDVNRCYQLLHWIDQNIDIV